MTLKPKTNEAAAFAISADMAKALSDAWRSRILMELSVRELSPSQFVDEVGGEISHISRCFRQLADLGYAEVVETRTGGRRRGAIEHVYRRLQRAHFDSSTWERLPRSDRVRFSGSIVESYIARIDEAVQAGTLDAEADSHLSWDGVGLDRIAWTELMNRLDEVLDWLPELAIESAKRLARLGEEQIPTTVALAGFRSPHVPTIAMKAPRWTAETGDPPESSPFVISAKMAKAVANKWRSRILMELSMRMLSPSEFVEEIGGSLTHVSRCFRQLADWGYIEIVEERRGGQRRGGVEKVYRSKQQVFFDASAWAALPLFLREEVSNVTLQSFLARVTEAIEAETFDAEDDSHFSWDGVGLDRIAWTELMNRLDEVLDWASELEVEAAGRMEISGEQPIPTTIGLFGFRSPRSSEITSRTRRENRKQG